MDFKFLDGDFFESLSDFSFGDQYGRQEVVSLENPVFLRFLDTLRDKKPRILFCQTEEYPKLLEIIKTLPFEVVLITHNSDFIITEKPELPSNLIKWYAQNLNIELERTEIIPIGLERKRWFPEMKKQETVEKFAFEKIIPKNSLYLNFNPATNLTKRRELAEFFREKTFATLDLRGNGAEYTEYVKELKAHHFILSPDGNGIDCHRTWEALYLNRIPILESNFHHERLYADMPVLLVDSYYDISESFLRNELSKSKYRRPSLKIRPSYYREKIKKDIGL